MLVIKACNLLLLLQEAELKGAALAWAVLMHTYVMQRLALLVCLAGSH